MGVYFIPAGATSKNRAKTLEVSFSLESLINFVPPRFHQDLNNHYPDGKGVYLWGANTRSFNQLSKVQEDDYAVDVKNTEVIQVFRFCFWYETPDHRLQNFVKWDSEKDAEDRRPYDFVYFLKEPLSTNRKNKAFFQRAFNLENNPQWLIGQKYFNTNQIKTSLQRTGTHSIEEFLGIDGDSKSQLPLPEPEPERDQEPIVTVPHWLESIVRQVNILKDDAGHLERDHEDLVANFFEILGFKRISDIKFQRGSIDIRIDVNGQPLITVEVKQEWALNQNSKIAINQAYRYANEVGSRYVVITNGDTYVLFDRSLGFSYSDNFVSEFKLSKLHEKDLNIIESLKKDNIAKGL